MNLFGTAPDWLLWLVGGLLVAAALQDAIQLRISNYVSGLILLLAIVAAAVVGPQFELWQNLLVFALVLAVGTLLFSRGILGGGDVKLFAAVALWADLPSAVRLISAILLCGGVLALVILFARVVAPASLSARVRTLRPGAGIAYGIAIAAGTLVTLATWRVA